MITASVAVGFSAFVFLQTWTNALPSLFGNPVLTGAWVPICVLASTLLGQLYFNSKTGTAGSPSRMFSLAILTTGLAGIPVRQLLRATGGVPDALLGAGLTSPGGLSVVLAAVTFCILFVPGFLFGGFLAFGSAFAGSRGIRSGPAWVLWPFCMGLGVGAPILMSGMLPHMGGLGCTLIATIAAAATGLVGLAMHGAGAFTKSTFQQSTLSESASGRRAAGIMLGGFYVFAVVAWMVQWIRLGLAATGPSLHASTAMLAALFAGLAAGCFVAAPAAGKRVERVMGMGITAGATGILLLFLGRWAGSLPLVFMDSVGEPPLEWADLVRAYFTLAFATVFAPALLLGVGFSMMSGPSGPEGAGSRASGFAHITLGVLAALLLTRFLPAGNPALRFLMTGLPWACVACSAVLFAIGHPTWTARLAWTGPVIAGAIVLGLTQPRWTPVILSRGYHTAPVEFKQAGDPTTPVAENELLFFNFDRDRIVSVERVPDAMSFKANGSTRSSAERGMVPDLLAGHIPLLIEETPRKVFLGGLGAGLTLCAIEAYPVDAIHCAEPSAAVLRIAGLFTPYNSDAVTDARLTLSVRDISNDLLYSGDRYDVIILKSPTPYAAPEADRLTEDFFSLVRSRLAQGGVVCQQIRMSELTIDSFKSVAMSFTNHFPHATVWWAGSDHILILGSPQPLRFPLEAVRTRMSLPGIREELARLAIDDPIGILSCFIMGRDRLVEFSGGAELLTSDRNRLALEWPGITLHAERNDGLERVAAVGENATVLIAGVDIDSTEYERLDGRLDSCRTALDFFARSLDLGLEGRTREAVSGLSQARAACPLNGIYVHALADQHIDLSRSLLGEGRIEDAVDQARRSVELLPRSPYTFYNLASIELTRDPQEAIGLLLRAIQLNPYYIPAYLLKAEAELASGKPEEAAETVGRMLPMEPFNTEGHYLRGLSFIEREMYAEGQAELRLVLEIDPGSLEALEALAYASLLVADLDEAEQLYLRILESDPNHLGALNNYATILAERGHYEEAVKIWSRALEIVPGDKSIIDNIEDASQRLRR